MHTLTQSKSISSMISLLALCVLACVSGCSTTTLSQYRNQRVFKTPQAAVEDLSKAVTTANTAELEAIFGAEGRQTISSGDPVTDRQSREVIAVALNEGWKLESTDDNTRELIIGSEAWPFPIPLVKDSRGWWFDTQAGKEEIRARRVGRNELSAMKTLRAYVIAQREYAAAGRDGKPSGIFAQRIRSDQGRKNGLYWPTTSAKEPRSPLGEFVATASAEGYSPNAAQSGPRPYHGYFYRILTAQGPAAPGGAANYIVNGEMRGGFAMVAYPAEYGSSGIMSFIVASDGTIYESDLGPQTAQLASAMSEYNPDSSWRATN